MWHLTKSLAARLHRLTNRAIITIAVLITAVRLLLPMMDLDEYRETIAELISETAGMPIHIGHLNADLRGAHLALVLHDVTLKDPETGGVKLHLRKAHVDIEIIHSLWDGSLRLGAGELHGTQLLLLHRQDGSVSLEGFETQHQEGGSSIASLFLRRSRLRLVDSEIYWRDEGDTGPPLRLLNVDVTLQNDGDHHQITANASIDGTDSGRFRLQADLQERAGDKPDWFGQIYLKAEGLGLRNLLSSRLPSPSKLDSGELDLELWVDLGKGRLARLQGGLSLQNLRLRDEETARALSIENLSTRFDWSWREGGGRLDLHQLVLLDRNQLWPPGRVSVEWISAADGLTQLGVGADYLSLQRLVQLFALTPFAESDEGKAILTLAPKGHLTNFRLALELPPEVEPRWQVSGRLTRFENRPWQAIPGLEGLRIDFNGDQDGGSLLLGSDAFTAEFPRLFRDPLSADHLQGYFDWWWTPGQEVRLSTQDLYVSNSHVNTLSRLDLRVPVDGSTPVTDIQTDFWEGDGAHKSRYLPVGVMPAPLVDWLDRSLVSGHVTAGSFLLYGPLEQFPFEQQDGRFEVVFGVEDMVLDYMADWPRIEEGVAEVHFINNSLDITVFDGLLLESRVKRAQAKIRNLSGASPVEIKGEMRGDFSDALRILGETPLRAQFGRFVSLMEGHGESDVVIDFNVPLLDKDTFRLDGSVVWRDAGLKIAAWDVILEGLQGRLDFDHRSIRAEALKGTLLGEPVQIALATREQDEATWTSITTVGAISVADLDRRYPGQGLGGLAGKVEGTMQLDVAHDGEAEVPLRLRVTSDLRGVSIPLPSPLGKAADVARDFELTIDFLQGDRQTVQLAYAGLFSALLQQSSQGFERGDLLLGGGALALPQYEGFRLRGALDALDADAWMRWAEGMGSGRAAENPLLKSLDLTVEQMQLAGNVCPNARVTATPLFDGWRLTLDSDTVKGTLLIPQAGKNLPLRGTFDRVVLEMEATYSAATATENGLEIDPRNLPPLELSIESLEINGQSLGTAQLRWDHVPRGVRISQLSLSGDALSLEGSGYWYRIGSEDSTALELRGHLKSLGEVLRDLGFKTAVQKAAVDAEIDLNWPESPMNFSLDRLNGYLSLQIGEGAVPDVGLGVGKVISLFSLNTLSKRLSSDFSGVFSKGLYFDSITGTFDLRDGNAYTDNFMLKGPEATIEMHGRTGLRAQDYEQTVKVIPRLSASLPLVGALAINPTVGVALVFAQQLFGSEMDRIAQVEYKVSGGWDNPTMQRIPRKLAADGSEEEGAAPKEGLELFEQ